MSSAITRKNLNTVAISSVQPQPANPVGGVLLGYLKIAAGALFSGISNTISFPLRYFGAKDWNIGNAYAKMLVPLTVHDTKKYLRFAAAAVTSFARDEKWVSPFGLTILDISDVDLTGLPGNISAEKNCFFDPKSGLKMVIVHDDNEVIITYGALHSGDEIIEDKSVAKKLVSYCYGIMALNLLGLKPFLYEQADALYQRVKDHPKLQGKSILFAGQCLGGSLASYVALKNQAPAICFNALPLGAGLQRNIGIDRLKLADRLIVHISATTDFVSDLRGIGVVDTIISSVGLRTPGNFGQRFSIPTAYPGLRHETHAFIFGSLMKHLGHDIQTRPADLDESEIIRSTPEPVISWKKTAIKCSS